MVVEEVPPAVAQVIRSFSDLGCYGPAVFFDRPNVNVTDLLAELDTTIGAFAESQLFLVDDHPTVVLTPGGLTADVTSLAADLGTDRISRPSDKQIRRLTGQTPGSVAPVGHPENLPVVIDVSLAQYERIWIPAGDPSYVFTTSYAELLRATAGQAAEITELN